MYPTREEAEKLLKDAETCNPGKWQTNLDLKEYFEAKMGKDLYEAVEKDTKTVF